MAADRYIVYGLTDPRTDVIRYVGKSCQGLYRARKHMLLYTKEHTHKANWIRQLTAAGLTYGVIVLERFTDASPLADAERRWIAQGRSDGWPLTNMTDGGDGVHGRTATARLREAARSRVRTPEERQRLAAAKIGNKHTLGLRHSDESKLRMAESQRARFLRSPHSQKSIEKMRTNRTGRGIGARHPRWRDVSVAEVANLRRQGQTVAAIARSLGVARSVIYRRIRIGAS